MTERETLTREVLDGRGPGSDRGDAALSDLVAAVGAAIAAGDAARVKALAADLHEADLGDLVAALPPEQRTELVRLLGRDFDFAALVEVDESVRVKLIEDLPAETVAEGVRELDSDDAVYILEDLDRAEQAAILEQIPTAERIPLERSLDCPENSAGRLMQTDLIAVPPFWTVGRTIDHCREADNLPHDFYEIYVVDEAFHLVGAVPLDKLLRAKRPVRVAELMVENPPAVQATDDREDVARLFERYNLIAAPVVDGRRLVGVVTADDIVDVVREEAEEDLRGLAGVGDEEISDSVWYVARSRFSWLFVNLFTAILASAVIGLFEGALSKMVALAVLMPIVASQGGNAGTQTMAVAVQRLATKELGPANAGRVIAREFVVGLINGIAFALIMGTVAAIWFSSPDLGLVIGIAMVASLCAASLAGIAIPIVLQRIGVDPAVASGPFVTTVTDVVGFFAFLGIATLWFGFG